MAGGFDLGAALGRLAGRRDLLVYMHDNPDPDSLASAWGLARLFEQEIGCQTTLCVEGIVGRAENRAMIEHLQIPLIPLDQIKVGAFDCVAIVDSQPGTGNNSLATDAPVDVVVDHHPARGDTKAAWSDIRQSYGATSTIVFEYLTERGVILPPKLATALFFALRTETRDLGRESTDAERQAYLHLVQVADHDLMDKISHPRVPPEHFAALDRALRSARTYGDIVVANLQELAYPDLVAEIADLLLSYEGARFVICAGCYKNRVHLSLRTDLSYQEAGTLMQQIVASDGSAGGHGTMAGGRLLAGLTSLDQVDQSFQIIVQRLHAALGRKMGTPLDLIP